MVHCSNGLDREFFLAPDGSSYSGEKSMVHNVFDRDEDPDPGISGQLVPD